MTRDNWPGTILTFVLGVSLGAIAALLFAPKAGEELRGDITEGVSDGINQVRSTGKGLKQQAQKLAGLAKDQVQEAIEAGDNAYSQAKKRE
jgi:gas vesicle protein